MDVATLWIKRKGCEDGPPELIVAWDGYSIEENWQGWSDACARELKMIGDDVVAHRFLNIHLKDDEIEKYFTEFQSIPVERVTELDDPETL